METLKGNLTTGVDAGDKIEVQSVEEMSELVSFLNDVCRRRRAAVVSICCGAFHYAGK